MSRIKDEVAFFETHGVGSVKDTYLCSNHFTDKYVKRHINKKSTFGYCNYCQKNKKVISLENFMIYTMGILTEFYTDAGGFMSYDSSEGGYLGNILESSDLFEKLHLDIDNSDLEEDIIESIEDKAWASQDEHYRDSPSDILMYNWNHFKDVVKYKARYLFYNTDIFKKDVDKSHVHLILNEVSKCLKKLKLMTIIEDGTDIFRCRQHDATIHIEEESQMAAPDKKFAIYPNRMSPAGIV